MRSDAITSASPKAVVRTTKLWLVVSRYLLSQDSSLYWGSIVRFFCTGTRSEPINVQHVPGSPLELHRFHFVQFSRSSSLRMFHSNGFDTMPAVCTDLLCVVCIGLVSAKFSAVNTELDRPMFWKPLCLLSTPEGLWLPQTINLHRLLKFSTQK